MGQELTDSAVWLPGQTSEHVLQIGEGVVTVQSCGLNQAHDGGGTLPRAQTAGEEPVLALMPTFA